MNRQREAVLVAAVLLAAAIAVRADDVDEYVKSAMQKQHIPAVTVAIIKDGALVKAEAYGRANLEHDIPARPDTVFKIGSVSKQFLAAGIMLLVQDGRIALDDKVSKHLAGTPDTWEAITIRHLLTHTSGLVREGPSFDPHKLQPDLEVIQSAYPLPLRFPPGEKWEYSNLGYFTLAEVIHRVSGKPWGEFLAERVFTPLGMTATRVTSVAAIIPNRAAGYAWRAGEFQNTEDFVAVRPSGAFLSTVRDLAKWEAALLTERILKETSKAAMLTPVSLNDGRKHPYGLGWQLDDFPAGSPAPTGVPMIRHGGSMPGFRAGYFRWPRQRLAVIVLTNLSNAPIDGLGAGIAIRVVPELKASR
jgi:CubicO group peptidase (beta-lactamase class C family)